MREPEKEKSQEKRSVANWGLVKIDFRVSEWSALAFFIASCFV